MGSARDEAPNHEREQALSVLRDVWHARERTAEELAAVLERSRSCKAMRHVDFGAPVDEDLREAWRSRLEREGKLGSRSIADLLDERREQ